jgi:alpha-mannosidase
VEDQIETTLGLSVQISRLVNGPAVQRCQIDYGWPLPESLDHLRRKRSETRIPCPLRVVVSLAQGVPRVDLQVTFDNRVRDHRLRMAFPSQVNTEASFSSAQFDVVSHPISVQPIPDEAWVEDAPTTFPHQDWVDLSDGERGLCIITRGLPEYEVLDTVRREVAITLLRAVGYLGAGTDLQTAAVGAGPHLATPEAQIQRRLTFSLAVLPHQGTWDQAEVWRQALAYNNPPRVITTGMVKSQPVPTGAHRPAGQSLLMVEGRNVILSSLKKAETSEALVLRLYNPSSVASEATVKLPFQPEKVQLTGLDEQPRPPATPEADLTIEAGGKIRFSIPPKKIITLRIDRP